MDVVVLGSVAVNRDGARIGKGAVYSDLEFVLLTEAGLVGADTLVVTTVHSLQVIDTPVPVTDHDVNVDLVITPEKVILILEVAADLVLRGFSANPTGGHAVQPCNLGCVGEDSSTRRLSAVGMGRREASSALFIGLKVGLLLDCHRQASPRGRNNDQRIGS
ncbi:5-formyltetrahydrofolate cyclo-ligase [Streptomyces sp. NPDC006129]|uniref:5-formyltetrahydrofolate cyclo-ligase n=1 Tax=Streptomyces sp. NPDC006129 TaxID=3155348 RepID=UPI00339FC159